ncbi:hypothetical protein SAMN05518861_12926 [Mesorhizobium sp. YR577]|nr:hypothetical protein SAMN05518861_12926 [Mesorhizobium sp. YR577]
MTGLVLQEKLIPICLRYREGFDNCAMSSIKEPFDVFLFMPLMNVNFKQWHISSIRG